MCNNNLKIMLKFRTLSNNLFQRISNNGHRFHTIPNQYSFRFMANLQLYKPSGNLTIVEKNIQGTKSFLENLLAEGIYYLKRTFQPSLLRRRRKHGMLSRLDNRNGRKIIIRRSIKKRRYRAC